MTDHHPTSIPAEVVGASITCTLEEICVSCNVEADWVAALVEHGAVEPAGAERTEWMFARLSVVRIAKAKRLERDLGLNIPGVALALELLDQIDDLRAQLQARSVDPRRA
jgi:chaperone modulatory protein CbpM